MCGLAQVAQSLTTAAPFSTRHSYPAAGVAVKPQVGVVSFATTGGEEVMVGASATMSVCSSA